MRADNLLARLAEHLDLAIASPLAGGEFGAILVRDATGRELILKALPSPSFAEHYARGARLAARLRARGYPAPEYFGTGVALDASWSLQERLPGAIPDEATPAHIDALLDLAERHAGAAGERAGTHEHIVEKVHACVKTLESHNLTRPLAREIAEVMRTTEGVALLDDGVVHGDFHHRNFLANGDEITGIFDWDLAHAGDWREDVVNLAFWCALLTDQIPPESASIAIKRAHEICEPSALAFFAAAMAARQLDFDARVHPERLEGIVQGIDAVIAPWWRSALR